MLRGSSQQNLCQPPIFRPITSDEKELIYMQIAKGAAQMGFRVTGRIRLESDGEEATHDLYLRLLVRAEKHWDRQRPLDAYIGHAIPKELRKYKRRSMRHETPQAKEE